MPHLSRSGRCWRRGEAPLLFTCPLHVFMAEAACHACSCGACRVCVICGVNKDTAVLPTVDMSKGMCMFMLHVCMCRRDLFMAVRLALAKLGAGAAAGGEDGDGRGMPVYGTGVTINTGTHQLGVGQSCSLPCCDRLACGCIDLAVCSTS